MSREASSTDNDSRNRVTADNPFSSRFVRPGAIRYVFSEGTSTDTLLSRFEAAGRRGQIVGPHGSGKSTLVAELTEALAAAGRPALVVALHDGQRRMPTDWLQRVEAAGVRVLVVDGYEQLSLWSRVWLRYRCRQRKLGLLVTSHADVGMPTIAHTESSLELAEAVVERLARDGRPAASQAAIAACFLRAGGNLRETLFALYDDYERRSGQDDRARPPALQQRQ